MGKDVQIKVQITVTASTPDKRFDFYSGELLAHASYEVESQMSRTRALALLADAATKALGDATNALLNSTLEEEVAQ